MIFWSTLLENCSQKTILQCCTECKIVNSTYVYRVAVIYHQRNWYKLSPNRVLFQTCLVRLQDQGGCRGGCKTRSGESVRHWYRQWRRFWFLNIIFSVFWKMPIYVYFDVKWCKRSNFCGRCKAVNVLIVAKFVNNAEFLSPDSVGNLSQIPAISITSQVWMITLKQLLSWRRCGTRLAQI